jgi:hypothetical protein
MSVVDGSAISWKSVVMLAVAGAWIANASKLKGDDRCLDPLIVGPTAAMEVDELPTIVERTWGFS